MASCKPAAVHVEPLELPRDAASVAQRLCRRPGFAWLDGHGRGPDGRRSFLTCDPSEVRRVPFGTANPLGIVRDLGGDRAGDGSDDRASPGAATNDGSRDPRLLSPRHVPRWIGYVAYDAAWSDPGRRAVRLPRDGLPVVWMARYDAVVILDHETGGAWIAGDDEAKCARLRAVLWEPAGGKPRAFVGTPSVTPAADHAAAIRTALEHIAAGDVYQVNLARRWHAPFEGAPLALWLAMRRASPVPFGLFVDGGDHAVLAGTMERFLAWEGPGGRLTNRPIKGTIARSGRDDSGEAAELVTDDKERAEHAMIVDLMRNDLGRVARTGSVAVHDVMSVEPYARLSHLVSTVTCVVRPELSLTDVMEATFPPGSVTGCPKVRAMEIIEALEPCARGIYTGCVGYVDRAGGASFAVAIRTAVVARRQVRYHAGGGLVSASVPDREIAETELKARVFLDALDMLGRSAKGGSASVNPERVGG